MPEEPLDLMLVSDDIATVLERHHGLDVSTSEVRAALVPFLDRVAPGRLTQQQRLGLDLLGH
jgi:hypothetical protein